MIATYQDRNFQLWEYRVNHGGLLIRSPQGTNASSNVDPIFDGVEFISSPRHLRGLDVDEGDERDESIAAKAGAWPSRSGRVFVLTSGGIRHLVVASWLRIEENDYGVFASPF